MLHILFYFFDSCWSNLLDMCKTDLLTDSSHWWFHLYSLVLATTNELTITELLNSVVLFIESSSLGEYSSRLEMIKSFSLGKI